MVTYSKEGVTIQLKNWDKESINLLRVGLCLTLREFVLEMQTSGLVSSQASEIASIFDFLEVLVNTQNEIDRSALATLIDKANSYDKVSAFLSEIAKNLDFASSQNESFKDTALQLAKENLEKLATAYKD